MRLIRGLLRRGTEDDVRQRPDIVPEDNYQVPQKLKIYLQISQFTEVISRRERALPSLETKNELRPSQRQEP